eukprot:scaffold25135_cov26-Tisochrysis_lutea.AAC.1
MLSAAEVSGQQQCIVCSSMVKSSGMRKHVGSHILQQRVSGDVCGFCGSTACTRPQGQWAATASKLRCIPQVFQQ